MFWRVWADEQKKANGLGEQRGGVEYLHFYGISPSFLSPASSSEGQKRTGTGSGLWGGRVAEGIHLSQEEKCLSRHGLC